MATKTRQRRLPQVISKPPGTVVRPHILEPGDRIALVDRKYALTRLKKRIEEELAGLDAELKDEMIEGEVLYGSDGIGYRMTVARQDVYEEEAIRELEEMGLLARFARVSTQKLLELVREGELTWQEFHALRAKAVTREIPALREVVSPDAKVI